METDEFEWDDEKAKINLEKHGVAFERATLVFDDPLFLDEADIGHVEDEERSTALGMADGKLILVVYAERGARRRLISARYADRNEHDNYYSQA